MPEPSSAGTSLFDTIIDRRNSDSLKWGKYRDQDIIPMWVADMDFQSPPEVIEALHAKVAEGVFGYIKPQASLNNLVVERLANFYDWDIKPEWLVWLPGLVCALNISVRAFAKEGETVISPIPVYYPFLLAPKQSDRRTLTLHWQMEDGVWRLDWEGLENKMSDQARLLLLCNPQNPNGRVLTREELRQVDSFCQKHNLIVCSDEVHCDLVLDQNSQHIPYPMISDYAHENTVTLMAPSKTFNLAGLGCAFAVIPNPELRRRFENTRAGIVPGDDSSLMGLAGAEAAYRHGEPWRHALLDYLRDNHQLLLKRINAMPGLSMEPLQATYLAWINVKGLGVSNPHKFFEKAGVGLSPGAPFGDATYLRLNFGCPRSQLIQALDRMEKAIQALPV